MSKGLRNSLIVLTVIVSAAALVLVGMNFSRVWGGSMGNWSGSMMNGYGSYDEAHQAYGINPGMMGKYGQTGSYDFMGPGIMGQGSMGMHDQVGAYGFRGPGMMGSGMMGQGSMGMFGQTGTYGFMGPGMMAGSMMGPGMMGSGIMGQGSMGMYGQTGTYDFMGQGMMGGAMMGPGMMGTFGANPLIDVDPLSLSEAEKVIDDYLEALGNDDFALGEIMIFDNHAYAQVIEKSTNIGVMELLVDPVTGAVSPEFGPNMMWNLKYSPMAGSGMMGMMSGFGNSPESEDMDGMMDDQISDDLVAEMPVTADEAIQFAQSYLDAYIPGADADDKADPFYGYYTLHINQDGSTVGMLSVNGYTGEVFLHTWHGELIEMSEAH